MLNYQQPFLNFKTLGLELRKCFFLHINLVLFHIFYYTIRWCYVMSAWLLILSIVQSVCKPYKSFYPPKSLYLNFYMVFSLYIYSFFFECHNSQLALRILYICMVTSKIRNERIQIRTLNRTGVYCVTFFFSFNIICLYPQLKRIDSLIKNYEAKTKIIKSVLKFLDRDNNVYSCKRLSFIPYCSLYT